MTSLDLLRNDCVNSLDREPENATEKELGYSIAMRHIIKLIDDKYSQIHKQEIVDAHRAAYGSNGKTPNMIALVKIFDKQAVEYYTEKFKK